MIIPHHLLSPEALTGVIEAFVTREGTDYGDQDIPLATKVRQVRQQLDEGTAVIVYDAETESCTLQPSRDGVPYS
ncbi:MAG: YheU family protein [Candidatus Tectimicrobiota bacterium]